LDCCGQQIRVHKPQREFEKFVDEYEKFRLRCEFRLSQLNELLEKVQKPDPIRDNWFYTTGKVRSILRNMSRLDKQLRDAAVQLLTIKLRLGLVTLPNQQPAQLNYTPGETLPDGSLFSSSNVKEAWRLRMLSNGGSRN
jgi:hypothetical protein